MIDNLSIGSAALSIPKRALRKDDVREASFELQDQSGVQLPVEGASGSGFHLRSEESPTENTRPLEEININDEISLIDEGIEFPEGGLKANLVVFGSFMGLVPVFGMVNSVGAIQAYVSSHQLAEVSSSTVSWIFSINTFISFSSGIFAGAFFDRNGARPPMILGTILFVGGLFATGNAQTVYQFVLAFGIVCGIGTGMLMSPLVGVVSHYFKKKRATYTSIATTGGSVGGIVMPLMLRSLYPKVGFAWAMRVLAFMCLGCLLISLIFSKERISNKVQEEEQEQEQAVEQHKKSEKAKHFVQTYFLDVFDYKSLVEVKFIFCALAVSLVESSLVICSIYFPSYAMMRGFSENTSYLLITVVNTTGILGRYIPGYVADKFLGRFNVAILTVFGCVLVGLIMWLPFGDNLNVLYAYSALYGFCSGSILSLSPVCCGQISRTDQFGKRYSTMYLIVSLTMLAAIPIAGVIIGKGTVDNYNNFIIFSVMLNVAGILCYIASRHSCVGFKLCKF